MGKLSTNLNLSPNSMQKNMGLRRTSNGRSGTLNSKRSVSAGSFSTMSPPRKSGVVNVRNNNMNNLNAPKSESISPLKRSPRKRQRQIQDSSDEEGSPSPRVGTNDQGDKSPSRSPSQSRSFDEDDDDDEDEDSLAHRYSSASRSKVASNQDDGKVESWL